MTLDEAKAEGQRYLDYLAREEKKSIELQKLAAERRNGLLDEHEARKRLAQLQDRSTVKVYDGSKLSEAIAVLIRT